MVRAHTRGLPFMGPESSIRETANAPGAISAKHSTLPVRASQGQWARSSCIVDVMPLLVRLFRKHRTWLCALAVASCGSPAPPPRAPSEPAAGDAPPAGAEAQTGETQPAAPDAQASNAQSPNAQSPSAQSPSGQPPSGSSPAAKAPESAARTAPPAGAASGGTSTDSDDNLDADIAELSRETKGGAVSKAPETKGRDLIYRVTPKGLVIEVNGIHFHPEAKAVRGKGGSYEILITLNAESFDERQYWLRKPKTGPLAIAGSLAGSAGTKERFKDQRQDEGEEEAVMPGSSRTFKQRWPGPGQPKLLPGQTVTLEVGLWGVRAESERERPVRRLFMVKMLASARGEPVISPPELDWGG